ncbi:hypothetical protein Vafri_21429, partial [Volvox africanus]
WERRASPAFISPPDHIYDSGGGGGGGRSAGGVTGSSVRVGAGGSDAAELRHPVAGSVDAGQRRCSGAGDGGATSRANTGGSVFEESGANSGAWRGGMTAAATATSPLVAVAVAATAGRDSSTIGGTINGSDGSDSRSRWGDGLQQQQRQMNQPQPQRPRDIPRRLARVLLRPVVNFLEGHAPKPSPSAATSGGGPAMSYFVPSANAGETP